MYDVIWSIVILSVSSQIFPFPLSILAYQFFFTRTKAVSYFKHFSGIARTPSRRVDEVAPYERIEVCSVVLFFNIRNIEKFRSNTRKVKDINMSEAVNQSSDWLHERTTVLFFRHSLDERRHRNKRKENVLISFL